jgi:hypothetical protein
LIYNNLAYGLQTHGRIFDANRDTDSTYAKFGGIIANNVFAYNVNRAGITLWNENNNPLVATIENNIFYENSLGELNAYGIVNSSNTNVVGSVIRNNVGYATAPGATAFMLGAFTGVTISGNSTTTNPNMVNAPATVPAPASPNFHLTESSTVAIGKGLNLSSTFTTDFAGTTRTEPWDIGAYNFSTNTTKPLPPKGLQVF